MCQRLIVDLKSGNEIKASLYFHWGAYFGSTMEMVCALSKKVLEAEELHKDPCLHILEFIESIGGGMRGTEEDMRVATEMFPDHKFSEHYSRDWGLMTFTQAGVESFHIWGEGFAEIELDTHCVYNGVSYEGEEWLEYEREEVGNGVTLRSTGIIHKDGQTCPVNVFEFKCEDYAVIADFMDFDPDFTDCITSEC